MADAKPPPPPSPSSSPSPPTPSPEAPRAAAPTPNATSRSPPPKPPNPALRMLGIPNIKARIPSRNWLIFISLSSTVASLILYDRYERKKTLARYTTLVSHLAFEPLPPTVLPRKLTVYLAAPPGDTLKASRDHFTEYVKPVLVAGGMDWEVVEGRMQGDVRAGLAERIRKHRRREETSMTEEDAAALAEKVRGIRDNLGIRESDEPRGDIVVGRHTWKEYVRGLHEGWLGPSALPAPPPETPTPPADDPSPTSADDSFPDDAPTTTPPTTPSPAPPPKPDEKKAPKPPTPSPSISASAYPSAPLPRSIPALFDASIPIPQPHILGFFNTPIRIYRFLTRRYLAEDIARRTAAVVLASQTRAYAASASNPASLPNDDDETAAGGEIETALADEESDWMKAVKKRAEGDEGVEKVWIADVVVDERIAQRMTRAKLSSADEERVARIAGEKEGESELV